MDRTNAIYLFICLPAYLPSNLSLFLVYGRMSVSVKACMNVCMCPSYACIHVYIHPSFCLSSSPSLHPPIHLAFTFIRRQQPLGSGGQYHLSNGINLSLTVRGISKSKNNMINKLFCRYQGKRRLNFSALECFRLPWEICHLAEAPPVNVSAQPQIQSTAPPSSRGLEGKRPGAAV